MLPGAVLATVLALVLTACGGEDTKAPPTTNTLPTASASSTAAPEISVSGLSDGVRVEIGDGISLDDPGGGLTFVSPVYELGPSGPLGATATVTIELETAQPNSSTLLVASRENARSAWTYLPATLAGDQRHVVFRTDHFSQYGVLSLDLSSAITTFKQGVSDALVSGVDEKVAKPECLGRKQALKLGFKVSSTESDSLAWCFGLDDGSPVIKVANRRLVPLQVAHGDALATATKSKVAGGWATWLGILAPDSEATFLAPGGTATYDADIDPGSKLVVSTEGGAVAQSLRALTAGSRAMVAQVSAYGLKSPTAVQLFQQLVSRSECRDALGKGSDALLTGCLSRQRLSRVFGADNRLLTPIVSAASMRRFWARRFDFLAQQDTSVDAQQITLERADADFGDLVGTFTGHTRSLTVDKDGTVLERLDNGTDRVIELTYQLARPKVSGRTAGKKTGGTTTATALLKRVRVFDRAAINGEIPKAGSQGTIRINGDGVVTPPFLQTSYCNAAAATKGACGA